LVTVAPKPPVVRVPPTPASGLQEPKSFSCRVLKLPFLGHRAPTILLWDILPPNSVPGSLSPSPNSHRPRQTPSPPPSEYHPVLLPTPQSSSPTAWPRARGARQPRPRPPRLSQSAIAAHPPRRPIRSGHAGPPPSLRRFNPKWAPRPWGNPGSALPQLGVHAPYVSFSPKPRSPDPSASSL